MRQPGMSQNVMNNLNKNLQPLNRVAIQGNSMPKMTPGQVPTSMTMTSISSSGISESYFTAPNNLPRMSDTTTNVDELMSPDLEGAPQCNITSMAPRSMSDGIPNTSMSLMPPQNIADMRGSSPQQKPVGARHPSMQQQRQLAPRLPVSTVDRIIFLSLFKYLVHCALSNCVE